VKMTLQVGGKRSRFGAIGPDIVKLPIIILSLTVSAVTRWAVPRSVLLHKTPTNDAPHSLASARYALRSLSNSRMYLSLVLT